MNRDDIAKLLLRLMVGGLLIFHGVDKMINGISFIQSLMQVHKLPMFLAYGVYVGELLAPLFLIVGWKSRIWAGIIAFNMVAAIYLVHAKSIFTIGEHGALAIESALMYLVASVAILLLGEGKYAISGGSAAPARSTKK